MINIYIIPAIIGLVLLPTMVGVLGHGLVSMAHTDLAETVSVVGLVVLLSAMALGFMVKSIISK